MNLLREKLRCTPMGASLRISDSTSSSDELVTNTDKRVSGRDGAQVSGDGNSVTLITTDSGAVNAGFQLGARAIDAAARNAEGLQGTTLGLLDGVLSFATKSNAGALDFATKANAGAAAAYKDASSQLSSLSGKVAGDLATAFTDSKAPDKSILTVGAVAAVAVVGAVMFFARRG